jgi:transcriptional regulator with XRE-family HTH domain
MSATTIREVSESRVRHANRAGNDNRIGAMIRQWRQRRRLSQLDLALDAGISSRHLSFVETGRSRPSPEMVLTLAQRLEVPLRERNRLLLAAGYAPSYRERAFEGPELAPVRDAVSRLLAGHEPYPALAVDTAWNLVASNGALDLLLEGVDDELLAPPANCMRLALHPDGLAPRILNLDEWRGHLLARLRREASLRGDPRLDELLAEVEAYPGGDHSDRSGTDIMVTLRLASSAGELTLFSTVTTFGTAVDITVAELSIEAFFPADEATAAALGRSSS